MKAPHFQTDAEIILPPGIIYIIMRIIIIKNCSGDLSPSTGFKCFVGEPGFSFNPAGFGDLNAARTASGM